jgi:hypothetical protein
MSITIDSMIDPLHRRAASQPPDRQSQVHARLTPQWNLAPGSRLIPRWTRLGLDNERFCMDKTIMVFGDAKKVVEGMVKAVE